MNIKLIPDQSYVYRSSNYHFLKPPDYFLLPSNYCYKDCVARKLYGMRMTEIVSNIAAMYIFYNYLSKKYLSG